MSKFVITSQNILYKLALWIMLSFNICCIVTSVATVIMGPIKKAKCRSGIATSFFPCNLSSKFLFPYYNLWLQLLTYAEQVSTWVPCPIRDPLELKLSSKSERISIIFLFYTCHFMFKFILVDKISTGLKFLVLYLLLSSGTTWQGQNQILSLNCRILALTPMTVFLA